MIRDEMLRLAAEKKKLLHLMDKMAQALDECLTSIDEINPNANTSNAHQILREVEIELRRLS